MKTKFDIRLMVGTLEVKIEEYQREITIQKMPPAHKWDMAKIHILEGRVQSLNLQLLSLNWVLERGEMLIY